MYFVLPKEIKEIGFTNASLRLQAVNRCFILTFETDKEIMENQGVKFYTLLSTPKSNKVDTTEKSTSDIIHLGTFAPHKDLQRNVNTLISDILTGKYDIYI